MSTKTQPQVNKKIPKGQIQYNERRGHFVKFDYHGFVMIPSANTPLLLPEEVREATGKKALVFAYRPGRTYGRLMDFGQAGAEDYLTGASEEKREAYLSRAMNIRDKRGNLTALDQYSKNHWSIKFLWGYTPRLNSKYIQR